MTNKRAPTAEQRKRLGWLRAMCNEAEKDGTHSAWRIVDETWSAASGLDTSTKRVAACVKGLASFDDTRKSEVARVVGYLREIDGPAAERAREKMLAALEDEKARTAEILAVLGRVEPAFGRLPVERAHPILKRADLSQSRKNGRPGPLATLAHLALACAPHAFDAADSETAEKLANRWRVAIRKADPEATAGS